MKRIQPDIVEVHRRVASAACRLALALLAPLANHAALAQFPASGLGSTASGPPASSLHGSQSVAPSTGTGAPAAPAWTPRNALRNEASQPSQTTPLQQANLPADLAKLNDSAIIIIGGKPTSAGEVKRGVLSLDDKAIIIIGGRQVAAAAMKRELQSAAAARPIGAAAASSPTVAASAASAARAGAAATSSPGASPPLRTQSPGAARIVGPQYTADRVTKLSPRRAILPAKLQELRDEQNRYAQQAAQAAGGAARLAPSAGTITAVPDAHGGRVVATSAIGERERIFTVNGKISNVRVTPGGRVLVDGFGLGNAGTASLVGGALDQHPIGLQITMWNPYTIDAVVPGNTRGVPDVQSAALVVRNAQGKTFRFDGVQFVAVRTELTLTDPNAIAGFVATIARGGDWPNTAGGGNSVARWDAGKSIDCRAPGMDVIHFRRVNGFDVVGASMTHGRTDAGDGDAAGNGGSRVFTPGYDFGDWTDENINDWLWGPMNSALQVRWGVFRSHTSPELTPYVGFYWIPYAGYSSSDARDFCESDWRLTALTVYGPVGLTP
jgi:hypothetical protein